jgi:hypothetical protein
MLRALQRRETTGAARGAVKARTHRLLLQRAKALLQPYGWVVEHEHVFENFEHEACFGEGFLQLLLTHVVNDIVFTMRIEMSLQTYRWYVYACVSIGSHVMDHFFEPDVEEEQLLVSVLPGVRNWQQSMVPVLSNLLRLRQNNSNILAAFAIMSFHHEI